MKRISRVSAREENVVIPTYPAPPPDPNPMFFERRVNQGASGRVYPNPFTDQVNHETKVDQTYRAVFLENEYIQLMILPQFGGRIHAALDKTNGYDFIYRQHVIKPALIGLFGSWLSGGMEFNFPLHHRPSTFMPVEYAIEHAEDGSAIVWLSEHEPMNRLKGMVGICLHPGIARVEMNVRLFNRTPLPQAFLWWVNCAVHINEDYQLIFPPDVESVTFHSRAAMASYPLARQLYAGCDFRKGVDLSWLKNVSGTTSYFANPSNYDFFGGYDHGRQAGIIHVADHHISPGKKLFTWGTGEFGTSWQSTLTDSDGPYAELMASAYSDNQPDFSWLQPYETKSFQQVWYPIQQIGVVKNANARLAVSLEPGKLGICSTERLKAARVILSLDERILFDQVIDLKPGNPFLAKTKLPAEGFPLLRVLDDRGNELIQFQGEPPRNESLPKIAHLPKQPEQINSIEELFLTGLHVEQYLHPSLDAGLYWERALQLDAGDLRCNNALGRLLLRRGEFHRAEVLFRRAIDTLTQYNFNPYDGEPYYNLGLALAWQGKYAEAYEAFNKSIWSYACQSAGYFALAQIDCRRRDFPLALEHIDRSLNVNAANNKARDLKTAVLRHDGQILVALDLARETLSSHPLDHWALNERAACSGMPEDTLALEHALRDADQNYLDLAFEYADGGLYADAESVLKRAFAYGSRYPLVYYALGFFAEQQGKRFEGMDWFCRAAVQKPDLCFPFRPEEMIVLQAARRANPKDGRAAYYLGNLLYDKKQYAEALEVWQTATRLEPSFSIPWRNLGMALYNRKGDKEGALACYKKAFKANRSDPRLLLEMDQLGQRTGSAPADRLAFLEKYPGLNSQRDDLLVTRATLYNQTGQPQKALALLLSHRFHPWEGGEGRTSGQYVLAHILLGKAELQKGNAAEALGYFETALRYPASLGEGRTNGVMETLAHFSTGEVLEMLGEADAAKEHFRQVLQAEEEMANWQPFSQLTYLAACAMRRMGDESGCKEKLEALLAFARRQLDSDEPVGFFTSRPLVTIFEDDPKVQQHVDCQLLIGLACKGLGLQEDAHRAFEAVLVVDPHHWEASQELKEGLTAVA